MIGVFDSGVGGLTVVKEILKKLPEYQLIYFGDTARLPYGTKGADFVVRYSKKITKWLLKKGAKIIVVACNTSSAWASDYLKKEFKGVPIFEMISPAVKEAIKATKNKKIGIIGTPGTVRSGVYDKKLKTYNLQFKTYSQACPLFVSLVEEGWVSGKITKEVIQKYLLPLKEKGVDTLILGCTHYPLLKEVISEVMGEKIHPVKSAFGGAKQFNGVKIINPAESLAKELKEFLENNSKIKNKIKNGSKHQFFFSDEPYNLEKISHLCFNKKIEPIIKDPF